MRDHHHLRRAATTCLQHFARSPSFLPSRWSFKGAPMTSFIHHVCGSRAMAQSEAALHVPVMTACDAKEALYYDLARIRIEGHQCVSRLCVSQPRSSPAKKAKAGGEKRRCGSEREAGPCGKPANQSFSIDEGSQSSPALRKLLSVPSGGGVKLLRFAQTPRRSSLSIAGVCCKVYRGNVREELMPEWRSRSQKPFHCCRGHQP